MSHPPRATVLHVEDDPIIGAAIERQICAWPEFQFLGTAVTVAAAIESCTKYHPEILLLDIHLIDGDGFRIIAEIGNDPRPRVLLLTGYLNEATVYRMRRLGVTGMITKPVFKPETLRHALHELLAGRVYFSTDVLELMQLMLKDRESFSKILSEREMELLPYFHEGETDKEIAGKTGIAPLTVKSHREHIMRKLSIHKREKLMKWCADKGFVHIPIQ